MYYAIHNDCDSKYPISLREFGQWKFDEARNRLILVDRQFVEPHSTFIEYNGKEDVLQFYVKYKTKNALMICHSEKSNSYCENYIRKQ